jgi:hypothetical protein
MSSRGASPRPENASSPGRVRMDHLRLRARRVAETDKVGADDLRDSDNHDSSDASVCAQTPIETAMTRIRLSPEHGDPDR